MKRMIFIPALMVMALGAAVAPETVKLDPINRSSKTINADIALDSIGVTSAYQVDYCAYGGLGEDNGGVDSGETAALTLELKNNLTFPITNVTATLTSNYPEAIVIHGTSAYPDLPAGGTANSEEPFWIHIESYQNHSPLFTLYIGSDQGSWDVSGHFIDSCNVFPLPLKKEFEVWPLKEWSIHGDPNYGGWKSNDDWGHPNSTGGNGLCAEGLAVADATGTSQELWSPSIILEGGWTYFLHYRCNFQAGNGSAAAYTEISLDNGMSWTTIGMETASDPVNGHEISWLGFTNDESTLGIIRFRLVSNSSSANWQIDDLFIWYGGQTGPPIWICVPCAPPPSCDTPGEAHSLSPQDGIAGVGSEILLSWNPADFADYYEVYAGPRMGQFNLMGTTTDTSFLLTGLAEATRYEWMISAINECGFNHSAVRSFTTAGSGSEGSHDRPVSPP